MTEEMKKVVDSINPSWDKDLKIRYLYINLAPFFKRDIKYFFASHEDKIRQYNEGFIDRTPEVVCSTLCDFYIDLFATFNIEAKKIKATNTEIPLFALIVLGDKGWYFLDPLNDLLFNQYGMRPRYFAIANIPGHTQHNNLHYLNEHKDLTKLRWEYLQEIDKEIGIHPYLDDMFDQIEPTFIIRNEAYKYFGIERKPSSRMSLIDAKMSHISGNYINLGKVDGIIERQLMYKYLINKLFDSSDKKIIHPKSIQNEDGTYSIRIYVTLKDGTVLGTYDEVKDSNGLYRVEKSLILQ